MIVEKFDAGDVIFSEGDIADCMYIVKAGEIGIFLPQNTTVSEPDFLLHDNEIFGEMALVDEQLRFATAKAMIASDVIKISEAEFIEKLEKSDVVIRAIIASLSQRLRAAQTG